jgi:hypothetical protein
MQFTSRLSLAFMIYTLRQHAKHLDVQVNCDQVLGAVMFMHEGNRVSLPPWSNGPGWRPQDGETPEAFPAYDGELVDQDAKRLAAWDRWIAYATKTAQHIPRVVAKHQVPPHVGPKPKLRGDREQNTYYNNQCK